MPKLQVQVDGSQARSGAGLVVRSLEDIRRKSEQLKQGVKGAGDAFRKTSRDMKTVTSAGGGLGRMLKFVATGLVTRQILQYADAWTQLQNRLKLVTNSQEELATVTNEVFQIAQRTRTGLESTGELYARIARSSDTLGLSQQRLLDVTESVSQAITISGVSADSANAAIVQLGQGLASGTLRGDELRSVLEQTPRLARAIAEGMGVTVGKLRDLGMAGKLTAENVVSALENQADVLDAEFNKTTATVGQAFTILKNSVTQFIGTLDQASGTTKGFAQFLITLADNLTLVGRVLTGTLDPAEKLTEKQEFLAVAAIGVTTAFKVFFDLLSIGPAILKDLGETIGGVAAAFAAFVSGDFTGAKNIWDEVGLNDTDDTQRALTDFFENFENQVKDAGALIEQVYDPLKRPPPIKVDLEIAPQVKIDPGKLELASLKEEFKRLSATALELDVKIPDLDAAETDLGKVRDAVMDLRKNLEEFGAKLSESVETPYEKYEGEVQLYDKALQAGIITQETFNRLVRDSALAFVEADPALQAWQEKLERVKEIMEETREPFEVLSDEVDELVDLLASGAFGEGQEALDAYSRAVIAATDRYQEALKKNKEGSDFLEEIAKQAARNIQDAFADFLFDPFDKGLDGLLMNFVDTLRRMAAEALSAEVFKILANSLSSMGGGGGFWGTLASSAASAFGGGAAEGGDLKAGKTYLVGERGPEFVVPKTNNTTVIPNDQLAAYKQNEEDKVDAFLQGAIDSFRMDQTDKIQSFFAGAAKSIIQGELPSPKVPDPIAPKLTAPQLDFAPEVPSFRVDAPDLPDIKAPDIKAPDVIMPEIPGVEAPQIDLPKIPDIEMPSVKAPEVMLPDGETMDINVADLFRQAMKDVKEPMIDLPKEGVSTPDPSKLEEYIGRLVDTVKGGEQMGLEEYMTNLFGSFGGAFETGGDFNAGSPIVVGEGGPEVITPSKSGTVTPGGAAAGQQAPPPEVNVPVSVVNVTDPQAAIAAIESNSGTQAILNVISQNTDVIKRALS